MNAVSQIQEANASTLALVVCQVRLEAVGINSYELRDPRGCELPPFTAGSHIDVYLHGGLVRQYSLCNPASERHHYVIAVLKDKAGRGGFRRLHETLHIPDLVKISVPRNNFELAPDGKRHILIAGGIGITPLKAMAHELDGSGIDFELHYCAKSPKCAAFREEIACLNKGGRVSYHFDGVDPSERLDVTKLLSRYTPGTHVYFCGPTGFMAACAAAAAHWPSGTVHSERFKPHEQPNRPVGDGRACVEIKSSGQRIEIAPDQSVADALNDAGIEIPTSCLSGLCGTCKIPYLSGEVDHQDVIFSDEERAHYFAACVSRPKSGVVLLDI